MVLYGPASAEDALAVLSISRIAKLHKPTTNSDRVYGYCKRELTDEEYDARDQSRLHTKETPEARAQTSSSIGF